MTEIQLNSVSMYENLFSISHCANHSWVNHMTPGEARGLVYKGLELGGTNMDM